MKNKNEEINEMKKWRKERINELKNEKVNERINKWKIGC